MNLCPSVSSVDDLWRTFTVCEPRVGTITRWAPLSPCPLPAGAGRGGDWDLRRSCATAAFPSPHDEGAGRGRKGEWRLMATAYHSDARRVKESWTKLEKRRTEEPTFLATRERNILDCLRPDAAMPLY